ncbi:sortase A [Propionicimonas paludicola]|uniref:Sortase A n=1 Tax=Propionicimonas paludicola TaxID=185243 RepID=A0A2A9CMM9_9ACTN|nr:class E sortase [Propionicimonas paludicola]PFG15664.1 sortase A [Propionicimonas paludicola]
MRVVRGAVGLLGELLVTLGVLLLLFVGWQLWWTDVVSDADAAQVVSTIEQELNTPDSSFVQPGKAKLGDAYAIVRIPRFGATYARPLYQGTTRAVLQRGVGHYLETAMPGEIGNFAMAGHRTTYGKPFNRIAELRDGDVVLIETKDSYFVYRVTGHQIVPPTQVSVLLPVPDQPGAEPTAATLTMTSCHPEFSARERFIVHAELDATYPRAGGVPPEVLEVKG